jgi:hypothetical protein
MVVAGRLHRGTPAAKKGSAGFGDRVKILDEFVVLAGSRSKRSTR